MDTFEETFRKLEWLSSESRQIIVARHAIRTFRHFRSEHGYTEAHILTLFRAATTVFALDGSIGPIYSPIKPSLQPVQVSLSLGKSNPIYSIELQKNRRGEVQPYYAFHGSFPGATKTIGISAVGDGTLDADFALIQSETEEVYSKLQLSKRQISKNVAVNLVARPLWMGISSFSEEATKCLQILQHYNDGFSGAFQFWIEWYQGLIQGKPINRALQRRVALIPDPIWEAGPVAVAEEIERIRAAYLAEKAPQAERMEFNPETSKFFTVPVDIVKPDLLGATLSQVADALHDVLANSSNGLHENTRDVRVLRRVFTKYGNDPQQIEMGLVSVHKGLRRQILNDELPASEENLALQSAVEEGARGIRATHPEVAENRKILTEQAIRELPEGAKEKLEEALPVLVAISDPGLAEDWEHDIPKLINDATQPLPSGAPPLPGVDEVNRIFSRAAKMSLKSKTADVLSGIEKGNVYRAAAIVLILREVVMIGLSIL